jgi:hypothetical protein
LGDIHENLSFLQDIPELPKANGVLITGDLTNRGDRARAESILDRIAAVNPRISAQIGNMDSQAVDELLTERGYNVHRRVVQLAPGLSLMGVGWSTPTPFGTPSEISDRQMGRWLEETYAQTDSSSKLIAMIHTPPIDTATDRLTGGGNAGSESVRAFIESRKPDLCLTGHIHESRAVDYVGQTPVLNPGNFGSGGYILVGYDGRNLQARIRQA